MKDPIPHTKIVYFAPGDIQIARVERQMVVYFCEALHLTGASVELIALGIQVMDWEKQAQHPLDLYRLQTHFPVRVLPTSLKQGDERGGVWWRIWAYSREGLRQLRRSQSDERLVFYTRNYACGLIFYLYRKFWRRKLTILFEIHVPPRNFFQRFVLGRVNGIVANTHRLAADVQADYPSQPIIGTHMGVNLRLYERLRLTKTAAREKLKLDPDQPLVVYTGKIYWGYREVDYILDAARSLPDVRFLLVGGREDHVVQFREKVEAEGLQNVCFTGFVEPSMVQNYQMSADLLLLYYPEGMELNRYRSPGKIFEYMAAGRPIVLADYPVLHEILAQDAAFYIPPGRPDLLRDAIQTALASPRLLEDLGQRGLERVETFTWENRARQVLDFISDLTNKRTARDHKGAVASNCT